jgi:hypothetical protein
MHLMHKNKRVDPIVEVKGYVFNIWKTNFSIMINFADIIITSKVKRSNIIVDQISSVTIRFV